MTPPEIVLSFERSLAATPERVFLALTEARDLERWFCDRAESEPRSGGRLVLAWTRPDSSKQPYEGRWVAFEPGRACVYEGGHSGYPDGNAGRIEFRLASEYGGTRLQVAHRFPDRPDYAPIASRYAAPWLRALDRLAKLVETAP